jgi:hypothetical protein
MNLKNLPARKFVLPLLASAVVAFVAAVPASATSGLAWTNPAGGVTEYSGVGYVEAADLFTVNYDVTITALGIAQLTDPYGGDEWEGIYNSSGTLLGLVDNNPLPSTLTTVTNGNYYFTPATATSTGALALHTGQTYELVLFTNGSNTIVGGSTTPPISNFANFLGSEWVGYSLGGYPYNLGAPTSSDNPSKDTFFAVDMQATVPTPEPESLLLLGSGLIGMAGFLRLKLRKN